MAEEFAILKLKDLVCHPNGEPMKQVEKVKSHTKLDKESGRQIPKTGQEILDEAPALTRGDLLSGILMNGIVPENAQEAAELNRLSKKVNNIMSKDKGEWKVDMDLIEKLLKLVGKVPMTQGVQLTLGDITAMLEDAKVEAFAQKHKKDVLAS